MKRILFALLILVLAASVGVMTWTPVSASGDLPPQLCWEKFVAMAKALAKEGLEIYALTADGKAIRLVELAKTSAYEIIAISMPEPGKSYYYTIGEHAGKHMGNAGTRSWLSKKISPDGIFDQKNFDFCSPPPPPALRFERSPKSLDAPVSKWWDLPWAGLQPAQPAPAYSAQDGATALNQGISQGSADVIPLLPIAALFLCVAFIGGMFVLKKSR